MRKLTFIMILLFCAGISTYAQKAKIAQASSYHASGKLDEAKKLADEAISHEKCIDDAKSHLTRGQIYQAIFESQVEEYKNLDPNPLQVAYDEYMRAIQLDEKNRLGSTLQARLADLAIYYSNKAVDSYNTGDFSGAMNSFIRVLDIQELPVLKSDLIDTTLMYNVGIVAEKAGNYDVAEQYLNKVLSYNYEPGKVYITLANVKKAQGKTEEAVEYFKKAHELMPEDTFPLTELVNYYLSENEYQKAEEFLNQIIEKDPTNASLFRVQAILFEQTKQMDKAEATYAKVINEMDPNDFISLFNYGVIQLKKIDEDLKVVNAIVSASEYKKAVQGVYDSYVAVAPYFERAYKATERADEKEQTIDILREIYFKLRNSRDGYMEKYEAAKAQLDELRGLK